MAITDNEKEPLHDKQEIKEDFELEHAVAGNDQVKSENEASEKEWADVRHKGKINSVSDLLRSAAPSSSGSITGYSFKNLATQSVSIGSRQRTGKDNPPSIIANDAILSNDGKEKRNTTNEAKTVNKLFKAILSNENVRFEIQSNINGDKYIEAEYNGEKYNLTKLMTTADWNDLHIKEKHLNQYTDYVYSRKPEMKVYNKPTLPKRIDPETGVTDETNAAAPLFRLKVSVSNAPPDMDVFANNPGQEGYELVISDNQVYYLDHDNKKISQINLDSEMIDELTRYKGRVLYHNNTKEINEINSIVGNEMIISAMNQHIESWYREQINNFSQKNPECKLNELSFPELLALNVYTGNFYKTANMLVRADPDLLTKKSFENSTGAEYPNTILKDPSNSIREHFLSSVVAMHGICKSKERKKFVYRFDEFSEGLHQSKIDRYDIVLMTADVDKKLKIKKLERISNNNQNSPVLIKQGNEYSMYGYSNGAWKVTKLDPAALVAITFPNTEETSVLSRDSITNDVYGEIKNHNAHRKLFKEKSIVSTAYTQSSYISAEKLIKTRDAENSKFPALTLYENAEGAVLTPISQTQHENEFALKPGPILYEEVSITDGVHVILARQEGSLAKNEKLKQISLGIKKFLGDEYKDVITESDRIKLNQFKLDINAYKEGRLNDINKIIDEFNQFKNDVRSRQPDANARHKTVADQLSDRANQIRRHTSSASNLLKKSQIIRSRKNDEPESNPASASENQLSENNDHLESKLRKKYSSQYIMRKASLKFNKFISPQSEPEVSVDTQAELRTRSADEQLENDAKQWNQYLTAEDGTKDKQVLMKRIFALIDHTGLSPVSGDSSDSVHLNLASVLSHGGRLVIQVPQINEGENPNQLVDGLLEGVAINEKDRFSNPIVFSRPFASHTLKVHDDGTIHEELLKTQGLEGDYTQLIKDSLNNRHFGMNIGVGHDGAKPEDGTHGHVYFYWMAPTTTTPGGLMIGVETSAPGKTNPFGATHGPSAAKGEFTATGGTEFDSEQFKAHVHAGLSLSVKDEDTGEFKVKEGMRINLAREDIGPTLAAVREAEKVYKDKDTHEKLQTKVRIVSNKKVNAERLLSTDTPKNQSVYKTNVNKLKRTITSAVNQAIMPYPQAKDNLNELVNNNNLVNKIVGLRDYMKGYPGYILIANSLEKQDIEGLKGCAKHTLNKRNHSKSWKRGAEPESNESRCLRELAELIHHDAQGKSLSSHDFISKVDALISEIQQQQNIQKNTMTEKPVISSRRQVESKRPKNEAVYEGTPSNTRRSF